MAEPDDGIPDDWVPVIASEVESLGGTIGLVQHTVLVPPHWIPADAPPLIAYDRGDAEWEDVPVLFRLLFGMYSPDEPDDPDHDELANTLLLCGLVYEPGENADMLWTLPKTERAPKHMVVITD